MAISTPEKLMIKKMHPEATLPTRAHPGDAGLDLYALEGMTLKPGEGLVARTGIAMALPQGTVGMVADRSSMARRGFKTAGGIIDAGYRGEIHIILRNITHETLSFDRGERIAQLMILPILTPVPLETPTLDETSRGEKGFGSSGR